MIALALDLDEHFFDDKIRHPAAIMRLLFYPELGDREVDELMPGIGVSSARLAAFERARAPSSPGTSLRQLHTHRLSRAPCAL